MRIQWRALGKRHPIGTCAKDKAITLGTGTGEHWLGELDARKSVGLQQGEEHWLMYREAECLSEHQGSGDMS